MRHLKHEIHLKQAAVLQARGQLISNGHALQQRTLAALSTPPALLSSFGLGFALAMLRSRKPKTVEHSGKGAPGWLHLLLRDVVTPMALSALQAHLAAEQEQP